MTSECLRRQTIWSLTGSEACLIPKRNLECGLQSRLGVSQFLSLWNSVSEYRWWSCNLQIWLAKTGPNSRGRNWPAVFCIRKFYITKLWLKFSKLLSAFLPNNRFLCLFFVINHCIISSPDVSCLYHELFKLSGMNSLTHDQQEHWMKEIKSNHRRSDQEFYWRKHCPFIFLTFTRTLTFLSTVPIQVSPNNGSTRRWI